MLRFDRPNLPRESAAAASHVAVLAQPKKMRGGTEPTKLAKYTERFLAPPGAAASGSQTNAGGRRPPNRIDTAP